MVYVGQTLATHASHAAAESVCDAPQLIRQGFDFLTNAREALTQLLAGGTPRGGIPALERALCIFGPRALVAGSEIIYPPELLAATSYLHGARILAARNLTLAALAQTGGNPLEAAKLIESSPRFVYRVLKGSLELQHARAWIQERRIGMVFGEGIAFPSVRDVYASVSKTMLSEALEKSQGNMDAAAARLGMSPRNAFRLAEEYRDQSGPRFLSSLCSPNIDRSDVDWLLQELKRLNPTRSRVYQFDEMARWFDPSNPDALRQFLIKALDSYPDILQTDEAVAARLLHVARLLVKEQNIDLLHA